MLFDEVEVFLFFSLQIDLVNQTNTMRVCKMKFNCVVGFTVSIWMKNTLRIQLNPGFGHLQKYTCNFLCI